MYLALYRKYRPRTFDDVISQPEIVTTLKNQIAEGQNAHAYLFTGSRGTGKTTCAKILAMALNCKHPAGGNPCLECESCREIANDETTDIVELDAASNSGVSDVHELQDQLAYTPVSCKYRVYILDEVHMLSTAAFNALLKTIEEPPAHVIFILATTELHKVPATILSRCQRFEFRRIEIADSSARLLSIARQEGVSLTQEAADMISRLSDGGMRDALSLLDRCIAVSRDVTEDTVRSCAGVADNHHLYQLAEMTAARNIPGCIQLLSQLYKGGKDIARVMDELGGVFRDLMISKSAPAEKSLLSAMPHDYPEIERLAGLFSLEDILRCLTLIQECTDGIAKSRSRKTLAEMCFVKLCTGAPTAAQTAQLAQAAQIGQAGQVGQVGTVGQSGTAPQTAQNYRQFESKPMGSEFTPIPDEKLDPRRAATVNKLREIFAQNESAPAEPAKPAAQAFEAPKPAEAPKPVQQAQPSPADELPFDIDGAVKAPQAAKPTETPKPAPHGKPVKSPEPVPGNEIPFDISEPPAAVKTPEPASRKPAEVLKPTAPAPAAPIAPAEPFEAPMPELNSAPAAMDFDFAPPPEEPPMEFIPQREFATVPEPAAPAPRPVPAAETSAVPKAHSETSAAKPVKQNPEPKPEPESKQEPKSAEKAGTTASAGYTKLDSITQPEWEQIIEKVSSPLYAAMLDGSTALVNSDGVLEIHTGNLMLQGMISDGYQDLERELGGAFGKKVRALVVGEELENTAEDKDLPVKELLDKARRLNIEVDIK